MALNKFDLAKYNVVTKSYGITHDYACKIAKLTTKQFTKFIKNIEYNGLNYVCAYMFAKRKDELILKKMVNNRYMDKGNKVTQIEI